MRLRFWRRKQRDSKPLAMQVGDKIYAVGVPHDVTPPPGWMWDDNDGWFKELTAKVDFEPQGPE